jgi:hypothetical protein
MEANDACWVRTCTCGWAAWLSKNCRRNLCSLEEVLFMSLLHSLACNRCITLELWLRSSPSPCTSPESCLLFSCIKNFCDCVTNMVSSQTRHRHERLWLLFITVLKSRKNFNKCSQTRYHAVIKRTETRRIKIGDSRGPHCQRLLNDCYTCFEELAAPGNGWPVPPLPRLRDNGKYRFNSASK